MQFFDPKEEVLDIQLTEHGRRLFSQGKFMPKYYSFSDEGIIYNSENVGFTEEQNQTNTRIVEETPYLKIIPRNTQVKEIGNFNDVSATSLKENLTQATMLNSTIAKSYSLGNMSYTGSQSPKIKINLLEGNVTGVFDYYVPSTDLEEYQKIPLSPIPQIDVELVYLSTVVDSNNPQSVFYSDFANILNQDLIFRNQNIGSSNTQGFINTQGGSNSNSPIDSFSSGFVGADGTVIKTYNPTLTLLLEEENTDNLFDNFEVEIYEISDELNTLTGENHLNKLLFKKDVQDYELKNGLLISNKEIEDLSFVIQGMEDNEFYASSEGIVPDGGVPTSVEYFLDVMSDNYDEISEDLICSMIQQIKARSFQIDINYDCKQPTGISTARNDIYEKVIPDNTDC